MSRGTKAATGIGVENEVKLTQDPNQDYALSIRPVHSNRICVLQVLPDDQKMYKRLVNRQWMFWPGIDLRFDGMWVRLPTSTMKNTAEESRVSRSERHNSRRRSCISTGDQR